MHCLAACSTICVGWTCMKGKEWAEGRIVDSCSVCCDYLPHPLRLSVARATLPWKPHNGVAVLKSEWKQSWVNLILSEIGRNAGEIWPPEECGRGQWNRESPAKIVRVGKYDPGASPHHRPENVLLPAAERFWINTNNLPFLKAPRSSKHPVLGAR